MGKIVAINKAKPNSNGLLAKFSTWREMGIVLITLILMFVITLRQPIFLTSYNFEDIFLAIAITIIVACGQMLVIIIRGIDLSVGSIIGLVAMVVGLFIRDKYDFPMALAVLMGTVLGLGLGIINSILITKGKLPAMIATLATMHIFRGMVVVFSKGEWVNTYRLDPAFLEITRMRIFGVPALIIYAVLIAIITVLFLKYTRFGRQIYALGSNPTAAEVAGIPVNKITFIVFAISGTLSGFAAVLWASRYGSVTHETGGGFELQTIAACVVGGVGIFGGSGSVIGVILGAFLIGIIGNALTISNINPFWRLTINGILIIIAVVFDTLINRRLGKQQ
ncbi:MAG TPA: ABC transporter permease [Anaerolineae bacterium]|nr:ABC transporter permease [Anaerolineae bacterium]